MRITYKILKREERRKQSLSGGAEEVKYAKRLA